MQASTFKEGIAQPAVDQRYADLQTRICAIITSSKKPIQDVEALATTISCEDLQATIQAKLPHFTDAINIANKMSKEVLYFLNQTETSSHFSLSAQLEDILEGSLALLESIITTLGIADFLTPAETDLEANFKAQKMMNLLTFFSLLAAIFIPLLGEIIGAAIIVSLFVGISLLSILYPHIQPVPTTLPRAENWTRQIQEGRFLPIESRRHTLDLIAEVLSSKNRLKTHPLLVGKSGVGKNELIKAFARALERGDYPQLQGKQIVYINMADLCHDKKASGARRALFRISKAMGRHRDKFILVFDKIHLPCRNGEYAALLEQLKTFFGAGHENFPHVIATTTPDEYAEHILGANPSFDRCFKRIVVESTNEIETLDTLSNALLHQAPQAIVQPGSLKLLIEKTNQVYGTTMPQPITSLTLLSKCIERVSESQRLPIESQVESIQMEIQSLTAQAAVEYGRAFLPEPDDKDHARLEKLQVDLSKLTEPLREQREKLQMLLQNKKNLFAVKVATCKAAAKVAKLSRDTLSGEQQNSINTFLLLSYFLAPSFEKIIKQQSADLQVQAVIDDKLIESVIASEQVAAAIRA